MKPIALASLTELHKMEESLFEWLAAANPAAPDVIDELRRVQKAILAKRDSPSGKEFEQLKRSPSEAITRCFTYANPLTKQQLYEMMKDGGFPFDPVNWRRMHNDNVNKFVDSGKAVKMSEGESWEIPIRYLKPSERKRNRMK